MKLYVSYSDQWPEEIKFSRSLLRLNKRQIQFSQFGQFQIKCDVRPWHDIYKYQKENLSTWTSILIKTNQINFLQSPYFLHYLKENLERQKQNNASEKIQSTCARKRSIALRLKLHSIKKATRLLKLKLHSTCSAQMK